ncbi:MAG: hypothetical protein U0263_19195 [Polyangiaceae bacterium]
MPSPSGRVRALFALAAAVVLIGVVVMGLLRVVLPAQKPPEVTAARTPSPRLTPHLLLVVVDGLRWDVATDEKLMPELARAMRTESSGELWAGRVSMTTSAVLAFGTGQRGSFDQVVRNVNPAPPPHDSWLRAGRAAGLGVMSVGDPAWVQMYGSALSAQRTDPEGVAIDVDFNPTTFRDARELRSRAPDALVVHFVTPDHQAHAYTVPSRRYREHIAGFDRDLFQFLGEFGPDWTQVVLGDHGAADSGTHGADVPIQRRTFVFARGRGVAPGVKLGSVDQVDVAGTLALLLGLPVPAHSRGHALFELLDLPAQTRANLACADAARARAYAQASGLELRELPCAESSEPLRAARETVRAVDAAIERATGLGSGAVPWLLAASVLLSILVASIALGRARPEELVPALAMVAFGVLLTWGVERLPGGRPNQARAVLFTLGNLPALLLLLVPGKLARAVERFPVIAALIAPGFLVATYTTNAQPESYVALVVSSLLVVLLGGVSETRPTLARSQLLLHPLHVALLLAALALLFLPGTRTSEIFPAWLRKDPGLTLAAAIAALGVLGTVLALRSGHRRAFPLALGLVSAVVLSLVLRRFVPPWPGRLLLVASAGLALVSTLRNQRLPALLFGLVAYALVSRDAEILTVVATVIVADGVGAAFARHAVALGRSGARLTPAAILTLSCFVFGLAFVQRIGIQGAIDFGAMDWGVAGFGDPHVPAWIVGGALGLKYALGLWLCFGALFSELGVARARELLPAVFLMFLARTLALTGMFLTCGASFWTGLRVLGDLPIAMLWLVASGLAWTLLASPRACAAAPQPSSLSSSS